MKIFENEKWYTNEVWDSTKLFFLFLFKKLYMKFFIHIFYNNFDFK